MMVVLRGLNWIAITSRTWMPTHAVWGRSHRALSERCPQEDRLCGVHSRLEKDRAGCQTYGSVVFGRHHWDIQFRLEIGRQRPAFDFEREGFIPLGRPDSERDLLAGWPGVHS